MISVLVVSTDVPGAPALVADLGAVGIHVLGAVSCSLVVREAVRLAPDLVVCWEPSPQEDFFKALELLAATDPRPVVVFTADAGVESIERALQLGVQEWVVNGYGPQRLRPVLQGAQARFRHEQALRRELDDVRHRFEERKLVDRAKGLLMRATQMSEEEAFRLLRTSSMQGNLRVGQVSRQVIDAARDAEALNRAGGLRMLSQRIVKLYALLAAGVEVAGCTALLAQSVERVQESLALLSRGLSKPTYGDLLEAVELTWRELQPALALPADVARLAALDELAQRLLSQAEQLVAALEAGGAAAPLHVINVCGRQRMLSQRLAKLALLGVLLPAQGAQAVKDEAVRTAEAFEQALGYLNAAPLGTPDIRESLEAAGREWTLMLEGVREARQAPGRVALAAASESLLELFDRLTERYERSMQMLTG